jgi:hypothetical protein
LFLHNKYFYNVSKDTGDIEKLKRGKNISMKMIGVEPRDRLIIYQLCYNPNLSIKQFSHQILLKYHELHLWGHLTALLFFFAKGHVA